MAAVEPAGRIRRVPRRGGIAGRRWAGAAAAAGALPCGSAAFCLSHPASARPIRRPRRRTITSRKDQDSNAMWGGRFADGPSALMREINASIAFDKRCGAQDIAAQPHPRRDARRARASSRRRMPTRSTRGSTAIADEYEADGVPEDPALEDIHMHVEHRLAELIGPAAGRLHTARSRNDQVATDFRLWVRDAIDEADAGIDGAAAGAGDARRGACRDGHARLHPSAVRPAGDARPSSDGLLRDAAPRPLALRRRARAAERMPARRGGAGRHRLSDRPRGDRRWRSASTGRPPTASTRCPTAISRSII